MKSLTSCVSSWWRELTMTDFESPLLLRLRLDEEINSTQKLQESQKEIKEFLLQNSGSDVEQAYNENKEVLIRKCATINEIHNKLIEVDPAYRQKNSKRADLTSLVEALRSRDGLEFQFEPGVDEDVITSVEVASPLSTADGENIRRSDDDGLYM